MQGRKMLEQGLGANGAAGFRELTDEEAQAVTGGTAVYYDVEKKTYILTDKPFIQPGTILVGSY